MILKGNIDLKSIVLISWLVFVLKMILLNGGDSLEHARYLLRLRVTQKNFATASLVVFFLFFLLVGVSVTDWQNFFRQCYIIQSYEITWQTKTYLHY